MKILFVGRSIGHLAYYEKLLLKISKKNKLTVLFDEYWSASWKNKNHFEKFKKKNLHIEFDWIPGSQKLEKNLISNIIEFRSYISYRTRNYKNSFYIDRWYSYLSPKIQKSLKLRIINNYLSLKVISFLCDLIIKFYPMPQKISNYLNKKRFDKIIISPGNMRYDREIFFLKSNLPSFIYTLSWDNLSTKGFFSIRPKKIFIWNKMHEEDAKKIQKFKSNEIIKCGSLFFEKWIENFNDIEKNQSQIIDSISILNNKKYILYLGSSKNIAKDETKVVEEILEIIKIKNLNYKVFIRPHPANNEPFNKLKQNQNIIYLENNLPEAEKDILFFYHLIKNASGVFGINTSAMLEVMLLGKYCNTTLIKEYYRTQQKAQHFKFIASLHAFKIHRNIEDAVLFMSSQSQLLDYEKHKIVKEKIGLFEDLPSKLIMENLDLNQ